MARTKEFDPDAVLQRALQLFWEQGYEATSVSDLVERLGVGRASLYATFGGKRELYLKALDRYREDADRTLLAALSQPGEALPVVRTLVRRYAAEAGSADGQFGCFVVNTAVELAPQDPACATRVRSSWECLEAALSSALFRAQAQGELSDDRDPLALASCLLVFLQGLRVMGKAGRDPAGLVEAAEQALTMVD